MAKKFKKPRAIIVDVEGTTTDQSFLSKTLFPFIRSQMTKFLTETYETTETKEAIQRLRESTKQDPELPPIAAAKDSKEAIIKSVNENLMTQIDKKRKSSEEKQFIILVWIWGYDKGLIKGHVFDDVSQSMHDWKTKNGIKIYIYSSAIVTAQQLLFVCSTSGNLLPLIDKFFDDSIGSKKESQSFKNIAESIGVKTNDMLFITDTEKEANAATEAGCKAALIKRPGNKPISSESFQIPVITSFADIKF